MKIMKTFLGKYCLLHFIFTSRRYTVTLYLLFNKFFYVGLVFMYLYYISKVIDWCWLKITSSTHMVNNSTARALVTSARNQMFNYYSALYGLTIKKLEKCIKFCTSISFLSFWMMYNSSLCENFSACCHCFGYSNI